MRLSDFDFELPSNLIAQDPPELREEARLFVYDRASDTVRHARVRDLPDILPPGTRCVANNSKVRQARLYARPAEEVLVLEPLEGSTYRCLLKGRHLREGMELALFADRERTRLVPLGAQVTGKDDHPGMQTWHVRFAADPEKVERICEEYGTMPLPPYITRSTAPAERYQPVFARHLGSAAAPTAGLHFTPELIARLRERGFGWEEVTLHVGLGTFLPLRNEDVEANVLHHETTYVSPESAANIGAGDGVLAIGTTSTRTLESHWRDGQVRPGWQETNLFIYPGYEFRAVRHLLTNFHLPKSSLLTLVAAFLGNDPSGRGVMLQPDEMVNRLLRLYTEAIRERYRFYSFGDAMLIL